MAEKVIDLAIIGAGPAGLAASIYAARSGLDAVTVEGMDGGQLSMTDEIENYPGFENPVSGAALLSAMRKQAERQGARFVMDEISSVDFTGPEKKLSGMMNAYLARAVVIATGAKAKWLGIPGEKEYKRRGVSACAVCDGAFFKGRDVAVIGGGDTALGEAIYLSKLASKVHLVHRRDRFRGSEALVRRVETAPNIELELGETPAEFLGDGKALSGIRLSSGRALAVAGAFVAIGNVPDTAFLGGAVELDGAGYVVADARRRTSVAGVFAAGDCQDPHYRQAIVAAGAGAAAAIEAYRFLEEGGLK